MNKEVRKLWLAALRSGEYEQGQHALRTIDNTYCCLGVMCNLYHEVTGRGNWDEENVFFVSEDDQNDQTLPKAVQEWAGLEDTNPSIRPISEYDDDADTLASLNDAGASFEEIADVIEEQL